LAALEVRFPGSNPDRHLDGLLVQGEGWWFNVRKSNTEPLVRLNLEARDPATMERMRDQILDLIRST
ncbi:MAG TPA: phosphomannomutase/phosphoglucomutase, partial [Acidobacteriota bacterium]